MTNINCSSSCLYQKDGKCTLENTSIKIFTPTLDCMYYTNKKDMK